MIKALHLMSDHKFVEGHVYQFSDSGWQHTFIYITDQEWYRGPSAEKLKQVKPFSPAFNALIEQAAVFDIVFVYNLDYLKSYIINRVHKSVLVIWYFYGTELYNELPAFRYSIYSDKTKKIIGLNRLVRFGSSVKRIASIIKHRLINRVPSYMEIARAMRRTNYLTTFSKEEYDHLQLNGRCRLPAFLPIPVYIKQLKQETGIALQRDGLLLGHSATPDANHIDIIELLSGSHFNGRVLVPLSYGENLHYKDRIRDVLAESGLKVEIMDMFIERESYTAKIAGCSAAVFNSYRQLAVGNILLCLQKNIKIYLNEKNPSFKWLRNRGFAIFSIQANLQQDIAGNQLMLLAEEMVLNSSLFQKLTDPAQNIAYLQKLSDLVNNERTAPLKRS